MYSEMGTITNGIFISNQSLDIITKTGNYRGANISELIPYTTPSSWCGIKAYVQSDNAAFFNIITNNNIVINAYRDGDGTYKIYLVILYALLAMVELKILILAIMDFFLFHILLQLLGSITSGEIPQS